MLKITEIERTVCAVTLKLEGRITHYELPELKAVCDSAINEECVLRLEMADVAFIDRVSIAHFQSFLDRGVILINCSPFIGGQISKGVSYVNNNERDQ